MSRSVRTLGRRALAATAPQASLTLRRNDIAGESRPPETAAAAAAEPGVDFAAAAASAAEVSRSATAVTLRWRDGDISLGRRAISKSLTKASLMLRSRFADVSMLPQFCGERRVITLDGGFEGGLVAEQWTVSDCLRT